MQLPAGAQTWLSCGFDNAWTLMEYLTASLIDVSNAANWQRAGGQGEPPKPVRRPADVRAGSADVERRGARARAFLARQRQTTTEEA